MADNQKLSQLGLASVPSLSDRLYGIDGGPSSLAYAADRVGGLFNPAINEFRLSLVSGNAVPNNDQSLKSTLYLTPVLNDGTITTATGLIGLFDGTRPKVYSSGEISLALTLTSGSVYDVWVFDSNGVPALETLAWSSTTARATPLATQNSFRVKSGAPTRRYAGTIYASGTNQVTDSLLTRGLWNADNRRRRKLKLTESTSSWNSTNTAYHDWNSSSSNQVQMVLGLSEDLVTLDFQALGSDTLSDTFNIGIGLDSHNTDSADIHPGSNLSSPSTLVCRYVGYPGIGFHFLQMLERAGATGTTTYYGTAGNTTTQSGAVGEVMA